MVLDGCLAACRWCRARLATDNTTDVCGPCATRVEHLASPPRLHAGVWRSDPEVLAAVQTRHFGHLVRAYRRLAGPGRSRLSQEKVGEWLGMGQPQLSRIENGPPLNDLARMRAWAQFLDVPPELLWFDVDGPAEGPLRRDPATAGAVAGPGLGRLRVGIVAPPWLAVPPPRYGGIELSVEVLARGLAARGHQVVLFATGDSVCAAPGVEVAWVYPEALGTQNASSAVELNHTDAAYQTLADAEVDVVHDHTLAGLFVAKTAAIASPVVATNHGPFSSRVLADVYRRTAQRVPLIAISHDQAASAPADIPVATVIHHGIDLDRYPFKPTNGGGYVAVLARFSPEKGIDRAIEAARLAGVPLKIAAKCAEPAEHAYYEQVIEPQLGGGIEYVGEVDHKAKTELLGGAAALLNPVAWPEPFGLVNIEALACGTPVVATERGAIPELIDHGTTGFLASTTAELAKSSAWVLDLVVLIRRNRDQ